MKQPFALIALAYSGGILLDYWMPLPLELLFAVAAVLLAGVVVSAKARPYLLYALVAAAGATNLAWRTAVVSPIDLRRLVGDSATLATVRGTLCETPSQRVFVRDHEEYWHSLAQLDVQAIQRGTSWESAFGRVAVSTPGVLPGHYFGGQTVEVSGVLAPPKGPAAEGLFDYRAYLRWQGIYHQLRAETTNDWRLADPSDQPGKPPISDRFLTWAHTTLARGLPAEDESLRLLWAMTLGWKTALTDEVSEPFMKTGTMHIFAISGLHIVLIAGILVSMLRVMRIPRGVCGWVIIPLIWFYTGVSGWQSSAIRSTIMMSVVIAGWALKRPGDLLNSLAASGFIILVWQPEQLFQASFQLSFFVV